MGLREEFWALPNLLTMLRIVMIPAVLWFIDNNSREKSFIACLLFIACGITDALDGWLARKRGLVTVIGKFLDPLADKVIVMGALVYLSALGRVAPWLTVVLLARELSVTTLRAIAAAEGLVIQAAPMGKQKMALQLAGICCVMIHFPYKILGLGITVKFAAVGIYTLYISLVLSVFSAVEYFQLFLRAAEAKDRARLEKK
jgi:CDP-diacylglycerol---glycerol-3-phosphate 3-phosphatidyltransferase